MHIYICIYIYHILYIYICIILCISKYIYIHNICKTYIELSNYSDYNVDIIVRRSLFIPGIKHPHSMVSNMCKSSTSDSVFGVVFNIC